MSDNVEMYRPIGEGGALSGFDEKILEYAAKRMSPDQMYVELGSPETLSPARILQRIREIMQSVDYLSVVEQKSLLLLDFVKLRDMLWDRISEGTETKMTKSGDVIDVGLDAAFYNAMTRMLKEWRATIESMQKDVDEGARAVSHAHAEIMMAAISVMFDRFIHRLEQHHDLYKTLPSAAEMRDLFEEVMPLGFAKIEQRDAA